MIKLEALELELSICNKYQLHIEPSGCRWFSVNIRREQYDKYIILCLFGLVARYYGRQFVKRHSIGNC